MWWEHSSCHLPHHHQNHHRPRLRQPRVAHAWALPLLACLACCLCLSGSALAIAQPSSWRPSAVSAAQVVADSPGPVPVPVLLTPSGLADAEILCNSWPVDRTQADPIELRRRTRRRDHDEKHDKHSRLTDDDSTSLPRQQALPSATVAKPHSDPHSVLHATALPATPTPAPPATAPAMTVSISFDPPVTNPPRPDTNIPPPAASPVPSATATQTSTNPITLPSPFDTSLAYNFTSADTACPQFVNRLLVDLTFRACYPFSVLLQTSTSLFNAAKSLADLVPVLDATCAADPASCNPYLQALAANLTDPANCGKELSLGQPIVTQTYYGLRAYLPVYAAVCLHVPSPVSNTTTVASTPTPDYCYADAITNLTSSDDAFLYYLPFNLTLPASAQPSCSWCVRQTMDIFHAAAADRSQFIADTYLQAATQIDNICGSSFLNLTLPVSTYSATAGYHSTVARASATAVVLSLAVALFLA